MFDFEKEFGFTPPRMVGYNLALVVHKNIMSGTKSEILDMPEELIEKQKYLSFVGRVCDKGSACWQGDRFKHHELTPQIGDWVVFKPNAGLLLQYRGIDMFFTVDDAILSVIEDPTYVTRD